MATWADNRGGSERKQRMKRNSLRLESSEIDVIAAPVGDIERAEALLETQFLHRPFSSYPVWKKTMEAHGFTVFTDFETIRRNTDKVRWQVDVQVYITNHTPDQRTERKFVRTLRLESTAELFPISDSDKRGSGLRRRDNRLR